jgi:hypothetical protein
MAYPDDLEYLKEDVKGTDAMSAHAELHNDANSVVNKLQNYVGKKGDGKTSGTITGDLNDLRDVVEDLETNTADPLPDTTGQDNKALMVRSNNAEWSQVTPDDVKYPDTATFVLPGDYDVTGKSQKEVNEALQSGILSVDAEVEKKYDKGADSAIPDGKRDYADAAAMESAVKGNSTEIAKIRQEVADVLSQLGSDNITAEFGKYYPKYGSGDDDTEALIYDSAAKMGVVVQSNEQAIIDNAAAITDGDAATLQSAEDFATAADKQVLLDAATTADEKDQQVLLDAQNFATGEDGKVYQNSIDYTNQEIAKITHPDQDLKFDKGVGVLEYNDAVTMGKAVKQNFDDIKALTGYDDSALAGRVTKNETDIGVLKNEQTTQNTNITTNTQNIEKKFDKGNTSYSNAEAMEAALNKEISDRAQGDIKAVADANAYTDSKVASVDHSTLATKAELSAEESARIAADATLQANIDAIEKYDDSALAGRVTANEGEITTLKAEQVTQNTAIQDNTDAINALVIPDVSDFTTKDYVDAADATKFDKGATTYADAKAMEDAITRNEDAINGNADVIETKLDKGATTYKDAKEIEDAIAQEIVDREAGDSENLSAINDNTTSINALSNRLDALENTSLSSQWEIVANSTANPNSGEIVLNAADWLSTTLIAISHTDKNNTIHDFSNIKVGDTIQIGVGPEAKAAGSSAAYEVTGLDSVAGKFDVKHLASTGTPTQGFIAVVAIYPAFDPSNYATQAELQAVDTKVDQKVDIVPNGSDNAKTNGVMALTQAQYDALGTKDPLTIYLISDYVDPLPDLLDGKFDLGAGTTKLNDATVMEEAIDDNTGAIAVLNGQVVEISTDLNALITNLGGSVDIDGNITLPDIDITKLATKDELETKFDKGTTSYADAKAMEDAIGENASDISLLVAGLGGDINNIEVDALPDQTGNDGKFLTTDGSNASWSDVDSLPDQKDQDGKFLKSNGVDALWAELEIVPHAHNYDGSIHDGDGEFVPHTHTQYIAKLENAETPTMECNGVMALTQAQYDAIKEAAGLDPLTIYLITDYEEPDILTEVTTADVKLTNPVDTDAREIIETQEKANQYFAEELETKLTKGLTWGELAGRG